MARIEGRPTISSTVVIALTEEEAGALDALAGYGSDAFLKAFYVHMGEAYLKPYEKGLRSLFDAVRNGPCSVQNVLDRTRDARQVFDGTKVARSADGES
jgi:hypothetical protein